MTHLQPSTVSYPSVSARAALQAQQSDTPLPAPVPVTLSTAYRASLISLIIRMCSNGTYANVTNFEWYIDTLVELTYFSLALQDQSTASASTLGALIRDQLVDVAARVRAIRPYMVKKMATVLGDESLLESGEAAEVSEVLGAAAWICGEYCGSVLSFYSPQRQLISFSQRIGRSSTGHRLPLWPKHDHLPLDDRPRSVHPQRSQDLRFVARLARDELGRISPRANHLRHVSARSSTRRLRFKQRYRAPRTSSGTGTTSRFDSKRTGRSSTGRGG